MSQEIAFGMKYKDPRKATWEDDKLGRARYAKQLTQVVKHMDKPFVMTLSAPWGSGKTFFLNAWRNEIAWNGEENADKIPCVYFSAWEYDCVDDPLLAIVGKMQEELAPLLDYEEDIIQEEIDKSGNGQQNANQDSANPFSKLVTVTKSIFTKENLCKIGWTITGRVLNKITANVFEDALKDSVAEGILKEEDIEKIFNKTRQTMESSPKQKLEEVLKEKKVFIKTIGEIVKACQKKLGHDNKYPILIMIDELDRCRPDYVISLLERIKNLFEVDGIFFVLAIDKEQLYSVVEHTFGVKKTEERDNRAIYLQKFVNMDYELYNPKFNLYKYVEFYLQKANLSFSDHRRIFEIGYKVLDSDFAHDFCYLCETARMVSIREFERAFEKFSILVSCYRLSSVEALIIWKTFLDSKPILYLFNEKKCEVTEDYYNSELNFIDNFILNFSNWYKTGYNFTEKVQSLEGVEKICCLLLECYIRQNKICNFQSENKVNLVDATTEAQKSKFRRIISMLKQ